MVAMTPPLYNCEELTPDFQVRWKVVHKVSTTTTTTSTSSTTTSTTTTHGGSNNHHSSTLDPHHQYHVDDEIAFELISRGLDHERMYMSLGVSGRPDRAYMLGGDVVVADYFLDKPRARDFYMNAQDPCSNYNDPQQTAYSTTMAAEGVCPDTMEDFTNDIATNLISGVRLQGTTTGMEPQHNEEAAKPQEDDKHHKTPLNPTMNTTPPNIDNNNNNSSSPLSTPLPSSGCRDLTLIRYRRPVTPTDIHVIRNGQHDVDQVMNVRPGVLTTMIWALGPMDPDTGQPLFHSLGESRNLIQWELGRSPPIDNCIPLIDDDEYYSSFLDGIEDEDELYGGRRPVFPFVRPVLTNVMEFRATIGPSGGERGYASITGGRTPASAGAQGMSSAWYINGTFLFA